MATATVSSTKHKHFDIKRNDTVKVITGKDAGKEGRVLRVFPKTGRVLVEHVGDGEEARAPESAAQHQGRHRRAGNPGCGFQRDAGLQAVRAHARGTRPARRQEGSHLQEVRNDTRLE